MQFRRRRPRGFGIRSRLLFLSGAILIPFLILSVWRATRAHSRARAEVENDVRATARLVATRVDDHAQQVEIILQQIAAVVRPSAGMIAYNDSVLGAMVRQTPAHVRSMFVFDTAGRNLGMSQRPVSMRSSLLVSDRRYFREALRTHHFAVGEPVRARTDTSVWIVSFALPIMAGQSVRALAVVSVPLEDFRGILSPATLSEGAVVTLVDESGRVVGRTVDPAHWVGTDVHESPLALKTAGIREGVEEGPGFSGASRITSFTTTRLAQWKVYVGTPTDIALSPGREELASDALTIVLTMMIALFLAMRVAGRISTPIASLASDVDAIAVGEFGHRSRVSATGEVGVLAERINAMATTLEQQTNTLREGEERYRALFELSPLPMLLCDEVTHQFMAVNDAAVALYGYSRQEMLRRSASDIQPPENLPAFEALMREGGGISQRRAVHLANGGRRIDVEVSVARTSIFGVKAWLAVVNDLSERTKTETALRESQDQLRQMQKIEAVGSLAAGIAHDFNNLLTSILGSCDLALDGLPTSHPAHEEVRQAREVAMRATDLTRRLLTFSRQQASAPRQVDVREVVRGMEAMLVRTLGEHVRLELAMDRQPCIVLIDPGQLEQVLLNLLVNARDAMPNGGAATVDVRRSNRNSEDGDAIPAGDWVVIAVTDTGVGMDEETQARAFEPFFTTKERGKGTGLGLSVVYGIVNSAQGHVRVRSRKGAGAAFRVFLPLEASLMHRRPTPGTGVKPARGGEQVLLVEDDDVVRRVTTRLLQGLGYQVLAANGPRQALETARDHIGTIDLLLTDVIMPGMNGREMAEQMKKLRPRMQIVYASGYTDDMALLKQLREQSLFFLQKPFTVETLSRTVRAAIDAGGNGG